MELASSHSPASSSSPSTSSHYMVDHPITPDGDDPSITQLNKMINTTQVNSDKILPSEQLAPVEHVHDSETNEITSAGDQSPTLHEEAIGSNYQQGLGLGGENSLQKLFRQHSSKEKGEGFSDSDSDQFFLKGDEEDGELISNSGTPAAATTDEFTLPKKMNDDEVLEAIETELGPWKCQASPNGKEVVIAHEPGALLRKVLIRGYVVLTNYRLCFIALLSNSNQSSEELSGHNLPNRGVIRAASGTLHRPGLTKRKRKAWFVLTNHTITAYPSSDELYEPLGGVRLSDVRNVSPHRLHGKECVSFRVRGRNCYLEFETEEEAALWIKEVDVARWKMNNDMDKIRISLPLVRIARVKKEDYLQAFVLLHLDVLHDDLYTSSGHRHHEHLHLHHRGSEARESGTLLAEIVFGLLKGKSRILDEFTFQVDRATEWRNTKEKKDWWAFPSAFIEVEGGQDEPREDDDEPAEQGQTMQRHIIDLFSLGCKTEELQIVKADLVRTVPHTGTLALSPRYLCFYRRHRLTGLSDTRVKIPVGDINKATSSKAFRWHHYGLRVQIHAHKDVVLEFHQSKHRDEAKRLIDEAVARSKEQVEIGSPPQKQSGLTPQGRALALQAEHAIVTVSPETIRQMPKAANIDSASRIRVGKLKVICLTIGSRGDVQPYIALCKQLQKHDHECIIVSHGEYEDWVRGFGIDFRAAGGDPGELMKLSVDNNFFSPQFFKEAIGKFKHWLDELLRDIFETCWDADLLIESPSTFGGIHVAEAIGCYYMRAFTMPWTKTSVYPQAFAVPSVDMGPQYNLMSYAMFDQILWTASSGQINRWRKNMLHLGPTDLAHMKTSTVPFMYNFSPAVVPPPLDWGSLTAVTGYWTVDQKDDKKFDPPDDLVEFIKKAKEDGKKLAYIGFGSITISDPRGTQKAIYEAVKESDIRAIVSKGWSERMGRKKEGDEGPLEVPKEVYVVDSIPHDWLFPQIDIAMHHGGAGTTGASLRAGLVTLIHPFFGDQYFWSSRVDKLGAGVRVKSLKREAIVEALVKARDERMLREKAQDVGQAIQQENGVDKAVYFIYVNLQRSKRPVRRLTKDTKRPSSSARNSIDGQRISSDAESDLDDVEEAPESPSRMSSFNQAIGLNGVKRVVSHPFGSILHKSSTHDSTTTNSKNDRMVQSPSVIEKSMDFPEQHNEDNDEHVKGHSHWSALHHSLSFQKAPNMPHMSLPSILKMSHSDKDDDKDLTEEEKEKKRKEYQEKHRSAKEEDQRRREALIERWLEAGRYDLINMPARRGHEEKRDSDLKEEDEQEMPLRVPSVS